MSVEPHSKFGRGEGTFATIGILHCKFSNFHWLDQHENIIKSFRFFDILGHWAKRAQKLNCSNSDCVHFFICEEVRMTRKQNHFFLDYSVSHFLCWTGAIFSIVVCQNLVLPCEKSPSWERLEPVYLSVSTLFTQGWHNGCISCCQNYPPCAMAASFEKAQFRCHCHMEVTTVLPTVAIEFLTNWNIRRVPSSSLSFVLTTVNEGQRREMGWIK